MKLKLIIGNKNYSSWSLRAWLYLTESNLEFEEVLLNLFTPEWYVQIPTYTPTKRVPVVIDDNKKIWDSFAIMEYLHEEYPESVGWPKEKAARAEARSISAEMHAGFMGIRDELPQNIRKRNKRAISSFSKKTQDEIKRVIEMWSSCRERYGHLGPWLFGKEFTIADIMYAPVALRFVTYEIDVPYPANQFIVAVSGLASIQQWIKASEAEDVSFSFIDDLVPVEKTPLTK